MHATVSTPNGDRKVLSLPFLLAPAIVQVTYYQYSPPAAPNWYQNEAPVADGGYAGNYGTLTTDIAERKAGMVRATQNYLWSQTQAPGGMGGGAGAGSSSGGSGARAPRGASQRAGGRGGGASVHPRHVAFPSQTQSKMLARPGSSMSGSPRDPALLRFSV